MTLYVQCLKWLAGQYSLSCLLPMSSHFWPFLFFRHWQQTAQDCDPERKETTEGSPAIVPAPTCRHIRGHRAGWGVDPRHNIYLKWLKKKQKTWIALHLLKKLLTKTFPQTQLHEHTSSNPYQHIWASWTQQYIRRVIRHDQVRLTSGIQGWLNILKLML